MRDFSRSITLHQLRTLAFGAGCLNQCAPALIGRGARSILVVTAPPLINLTTPLVDDLRKGGCLVRVWSEAKQEPTIRDFEAALAVGRETRADAVIGFGGGSAMDVAKLVSAFLSSPQSPGGSERSGGPQSPGGSERNGSAPSRPAIEGSQSVYDAFGIGKLQSRSTHLVCIPTTSGTGSEVSPIAILLDEADELKKGVVSPHLVPDAAYVDPLLAVSMPPSVTAATGIDAFTHCLEAFANRQAHPIVDNYAIEGLRLISGNLARAIADGNDIEARTCVSLGSLYGGLCLGPVNTAAIHALSYPLGGEFHVAHGVANAVLLPHVLEFNLPAAPWRYAEVAIALGAQPGGTDEQIARRGLDLVRELLHKCGLPSRLSQFGIGASSVEHMARAAMTVQRLLEKNLRLVTEKDAQEIYKAAL